jgi:nitrite reductase (NADH) small subunit
LSVEGEEIAVFRIVEESGEKLYAVSNRCPFSGANVIARGITGNLGNRVVVASPIYKQHFDLATGECLEEPGKNLTTYPVRRNGKRVEISLQQEVTP